MREREKHVQKPLDFGLFCFSLFLASHTKTKKMLLAPHVLLLGSTKVIQTNHNRKRTFTYFELRRVNTKKREVRAYTYMYRLNVQVIFLASFLFLLIVLLSSNFIQGGKLSVVF